MEGWKTDITGCRNYDELPEQAKAYIKEIKNFTGVPVKIVFGKYCVVNTDTIIKHNCNLGDNVFTGSGALICGDRKSTRLNSSHVVI